MSFTTQRRDRDPGVSHSTHVSCNGIATRNTRQPLPRPRQHAQPHQAICVTKMPLTLVVRARCSKPQVLWNQPCYGTALARLHMEGKRCQQSNTRLPGHCHVTSNPDWHFLWSHANEWAMLCKGASPATENEITTGTLSLRVPRSIYNACTHPSDISREIV